MRYLYNYSKFYEELDNDDDDYGDDSDDLDITPSETMIEEDPADVKEAEKGLEDIQKKIKEYKSNKSKIDNLYNTDDSVSSEDLSKIVGEGEKRNEFLVSYANIKSLELKIKKLQNNIERDKIKMDEYQSSMSDASDEMKAEYQSAIQKKTENIGIKNKQLQDAMKSLPELEKSHKEKMDSIEDKIKDWIEKISK